MNGADSTGCRSHPAPLEQPGQGGFYTGALTLYTAAMTRTIYTVDVDRPDTWARYRKGMCDTCAANCCTMPVEVRLPDLVRLGLVDPFEAEHEDPKQIAKRLTKMKLVARFHARHGLFTLAQRASGDCHFLDAVTRRCTVYDQRPATCRRHPEQVGPRPGYCPYGPRAQAPAQD